MTIAELRKKLDEYPDDNFVHIRIWTRPPIGFEFHFDTVVDKVQQGVDGSMLITGTRPKAKR